MLPLMSVAKSTSLVLMMVNEVLKVGADETASVVRSAYVGAGGGLAAFRSSVLISESTPTPHAARHIREVIRRVFMLAVNCNRAAHAQSLVKRVLATLPVGVSSNERG